MHLSVLAPPLALTTRPPVTCRYHVCPGDATVNLDHTTIAALQGDGIFDAMTGVPANLTLPPPGFGGSYRHHMGRAMGALRHSRS